jgi:hypothetical protein
MARIAVWPDFDRASDIDHPADSAIGLVVYRMSDALAVLRDSGAEPVRIPAGGLDAAGQQSLVGSNAAGIRPGWGPPWDGPGRRVRAGRPLRQ